MSEYIVHKAVGLDKVKVKLRQTLEWYGQFYDAFRKYDGCCAVLNKGTTYSRTGEQYQCLDEVAQDAAFNDLVIIGEAWWPGPGQFNVISGEFRRHARSERLDVRVHDVLTQAEFDCGRSPVGFRKRMERIADEGHRWSRASGWPAGTYGDPQDKCNELVQIGGYDGLVLRDPNGTWTKGSGTTGEILKVKRVLSYDLEVLEVNTVIGEKTGREVHKLIVRFGDRRLGVGSGVPHDRADLPRVGDTVEVEGMDLSSEGLLREPRFKGIRFDKVKPDA